MGEVLVKTFRDAQWQEYRDLRLRALKDSPEAFCATFEAASRMSEAEWQARLKQASPEFDFPVAALVAESLAGMAWGKIQPPEPAIAHLYQMWVAPEWRGQGVGRAIVKAVIEWARSQNANILSLGVTGADTPARKLYESEGFVPVGDPEPLKAGSEVMVQTMQLKL